MPKNDGGQAFPGREETYVETSYGRIPATNQFPGMTLRDWFAGQALAGIMQNELLAENPEGAIAKLSYGVADAMLAEREKGNA